MEGIQLSVKQTGANNDISIIKVGGYIDTTTSAELERSLDYLLESDNYNIIIDLGNVDYISSAGWGIFISELKGIRDKGGDLKLVNMMPDVYEVFELLEFHYILKAFDSIEDAIADFDKRKVVDDTKSFSEGADYSREAGTSTGGRSDEDQGYASQADSSDISQQSVEDKIKQLVIENPDMSSIKMLKELNTEKFGNVKMGYFQLVKHLKKLNLNSKKKRMEYFKKQGLN
ncbi:anti-sigma factor antagonist [candidate division KSB1 bacterium]|nr:anti-sigma factor antagonist [candidate division KSB1 bacterium]